MAGFNEWSTTPASNASIGAIAWQEGQLPSTVNNSAREMMSDLAKVGDGTTIATGWHVKANGFGLHDQTDTTKKVIFDTSAVSTGTTRTIAWPNTAGTVALTSQIPPTDATYVVASANGTLTAERVLTAGSNVTITDSSTAGTITVASAAKIAQVVNSQTGAVATGTTTIPLDDTIPQNTEGDQYMTLAVTPTNASSTLIIEVIFNGSPSTAVGVAVALFQDSTANALAADVQSVVAGGAAAIGLRHKMTAGTTSATTFKVRAGPSAAATLTFNGVTAGRYFGGIYASSITITEILP